MSKMKYRIPVVAFALLTLLFSLGSAQSSDGDDLERSVGLMAKIGSCGSPSFSPDGTRIAFISNLTGIPQIWIVPTEGGWPELVTALDDPVGSVSWSPNGEWLAFSVSPGGGMNSQAYVVHPDGTGMRRVTDGGKEGNWLGDWTKDSHFITVASNRRDPSSMDAYLVEVETREFELIAENPGIGFLADVSHDRRFGLLYRVRSRGDNNLYLVDLASGKETLLTPHEGPGSFGGSLHPDGRQVLVSSNKDRDLSVFGVIRLGALPNARMGSWRR
jgi:Tol biopolymer transport system component